MNYRNHRSIVLAKIISNKALQPYISSPSRPHPLRRLFSFLIHLFSFLPKAPSGRELSAPLTEGVNEATLRCTKHHSNTMFAQTYHADKLQPSFAPKCIAVSTHEGVARSNSTAVSITTHKTFRMNYHSTSPRTALLADARYKIADTRIIKASK